LILCTIYKTKRFSWYNSIKSRWDILSKGGRHTTENIIKRCHGIFVKSLIYVCVSRKKNIFFRQSSLVSPLVMFPQLCFYSRLPMKFRYLFSMHCRRKVNESQARPSPLWFYPAATLFRDRGRCGGGAERTYSHQIFAPSRLTAPQMRSAAVCSPSRKISLSNTTAPRWTTPETSKYRSTRKQIITRSW